MSVFGSWFRRSPPPPAVTLKAPPRLILTVELVGGLGSVLASEIKRGHEGIAYLLGITTGTMTMAATAVRPDATTSPGSFKVDAPAMAKVVRVAADLGLHVVGQLHTHPGAAYHSDGDVEGARIAYPGFVSIVLPSYGRALPALDGAAVFMFQQGSGFTQLGERDLVVAHGQVDDD